MSQINLNFEADAPLLSTAELASLVDNLSDWKLVSVGGINQLRRRYQLADFASALNLVNLLGQLAESMNHHPTIELSWGKVTVIWWTHTVSGLTTNDFYLADRTDQLYIRSIGVSASTPSLDQSDH